MARSINDWSGLHNQLSEKEAIQHVLELGIQKMRCTKIVNIKISNKYKTIKVNNI